MAQAAAAWVCDAARKHGRGSAFAALLVEEPSQPRQASASIDIILGDIVIRARQDADDRHLSRVIRAVPAAIRSLFRHRH